MWVPFLGTFLLLHTLYHALAVTQHACYCKGTAVINGAFKELSLDDFIFFFFTVLFLKAFIGI